MPGKHIISVIFLFLAGLGLSLTFLNEPAGGNTFHAGMMIIDMILIDVSAVVVAKSIECTDRSVYIDGAGSDKIVYSSYKEHDGCIGVVDRAS